MLFASDKTRSRNRDTSLPHGLCIQERGESDHMTRSKQNAIPVGRHEHKNSRSLPSSKMHTESSTPISCTAHRPQATCFPLSFRSWTLLLTQQLDVTDLRGRVYGLLGMKTKHNDPDAGSLFVKADHTINQNVLWKRLAESRSKQQAIFPCCQASNTRLGRTTAST